MQKQGQRGPNKKKRFTDYTKQHQARIGHGFKEDCHCHFRPVQFYCHQG